MAKRKQNESRDEYSGEDLDDFMEHMIRGGEGPFGEGAWDPFIKQHREYNYDVSQYLSDAVWSEHLAYHLTTDALHPYQGPLMNNGKPRLVDVSIRTNPTRFERDVFSWMTKDIATLFNWNDMPGFIQRDLYLVQLMKWTKRVGWLHNLPRELVVFAHRQNAKNRDSKAQEPLSEREQAVLDIIMECHPKAITGREILKRLDVQGLIIDQGSLTGKIIPRLSPLGVRNRRRVGYYIEETESSL